VTLSPSGLTNGGAGFGLWLRPLPHSYTNELAGYEVYGDLFRFATTTVTVPARLLDGIAKGGAGMRAEIQFNADAEYARIAVTPGGGSGSVTYRAATATHTDAGVLGLSPRVGDQLKLSIYYDQKGHVAFTATDLTLGNEKYLADFWIIEAADLDVALNLATEGAKACNRKARVRRYAAKAVGRAYGRRRCPAMASTIRIVHNRRTSKSPKEIREAVSDRGRGVRSRGERPPARGVPNHRR
jgi:hypothetical protein